MTILEACKILNITKQVDLKELKTLYHLKMKTIHPDVGGLLNDAQDVTLAYTYLKKHFYDIEKQLKSNIAVTTETIQLHIQELYTIIIGGEIKCHAVNKNDIIYLNNHNIKNYNVIVYAAPTFTVLYNNGTEEVILKDIYFAYKGNMKYKVFTSLDVDIRPIERITLSLGIFKDLTLYMPKYTSSFIFGNNATFTIEVTIELSSTLKNLRHN